MLEVSKTNSRTTLESSPGKLPWIGEFVISSLNFKHIVMANCNVLINNQLSLDWFKTQALTLGEKKSSIILKMCEVRRNDILPLILIIICHHNNI